jgi:hypothetical protein
MKRPIALLMTLVMVLSTFIAYVPAYATSPNYSQIIEDDSMSFLLGLNPQGKHIFVKDPIYVPDRDGWWGPVEVQYLGHSYYEVLDMTQMEVGTYDLVLTKDDWGGADASILLEFKFDVLSNPAPVANDDSYGPIDEDSAAIDLMVLANDTDLDNDNDGQSGEGDQIQITGLISADPGFDFFAGKLVYTPPANFNGTATAVYQITDDSNEDAKSDTATVTVDVTSIEDLPVAVDDAITVDVNSATTPIAVLANDSDDDGDSISIASVQGLDPTKGTAEVNGSNIDFTPATDFYGTVTFTYTISANGSFDTASVVVTVIPEGGQPSNSLVNDVATLNEDTTLTIDVLDNDSLGAGVKSVTIKTNPLHGTATVQGTSVLYEPGADYNGPDSFVYVVTDLFDATTEATVTITVNQVLDPILATDDTIYVRRGGTRTVDVGYNDLLGEGFLSVAIHVNGSYGNASFNLDDEFVYTHTDGSLTPDQVQYILTDTAGQTSVATVNIIVLESNESPSMYLDDMTLVTNEGQIDNLDLGFGEFLSPDRYVKGVSILSGPEHGIATINESGIFTYHADDTWNTEFELRRVGWFKWKWVPINQDEVYYEVTLDNDEKLVGKVKITVKETDNLLLINDDRAINEDSGWLDMMVFENDMIDEGIDEVGFGIPLVGWFIDQGPYNGSVRIKDDILGLRIQYKPDPNFNGTDEFRYWVRDNDDSFDVATVEVTVVPETDFYNYNNPEGFEIDKDETLQFNPLATATGPIQVSTNTSVMDLFGPVVNVDFDYDQLTFGTLDWNADGTITYDPGNHYAGSVLISFVMTNQYGDILSGSVWVDVGLFSDNILVHLGAIVGVMPDGTEIEGFFVQQFEEFDLWEAVTYGKVDNLDITMEGATIHVIGEDGYVYPDETRIDRDGLVALDSYGSLMIGYQVKDEANHTGASIPRLLTVNHQPVLGRDVIVPDDPWNVETTDGDPVPGIDILFHEEGFDLWDYIYLYDFEEYDGNLNNPISNEPLPEGFEVVFIRNDEVAVGTVEEEPEVMEYQFSEFWDVFDIGLDDDPSDDLDIETSITIIARDNMGGEGRLEVPVIIRNNLPEITLSETLVIIQENEVFNMLDYASAEDYEDNYLGLTDSPVITWDIEIHAVEAPWPGELDVIDTSYAGQYIIEYTATDIMGGEDSDILFLYVVEPPEVTVEPLSVEIEPDGLFPVWNGVNVDFWLPRNMIHEPDTDSVSTEGRTNDYSLRAFLNYGMPNEVELFDTVSFDLEGTYTITYVASMRIDKDNVCFQYIDLLTDEADYYFNLTTVERQIVVSDEDLGDFIYISDVLPSLMMQAPVGVTEETEEDSIPSEEWFDMYDEYELYSVIMKYYPESGHERILTAVDFDSVEGSGRKYMDTENNPAFDDIAVTNDGDIYGLINDNVWRIYPNGALDYVFNIYEELDKVYEGYISSELFNFQGMTANEMGYLVIPTVYSGLYTREYNAYNFQDGLLFFDPDGFEYIFPVPEPEEPEEEEPGQQDTVSTADEPSQPPSETRYLVELGLVNQGDSDWYETITDIAYNADLTMIYGIGGYWDMPERPEPPTPPEVIETGQASVNTENYYALFALKESDINPEDVDMMMDLPDYLTIKLYDVTSLYDLDPGYRYKGIATLDEEIFVTEYAYPDYYFEFVIPGVDTEPVTMPEFFETKVHTFTYGDGEFVQGDNDMIDGMFKGALGAASMFNTEFEVDPANTTVYVGYLPTSTLVSYASRVFPEKAYGPVQFTVNSGSQYLLDAEGPDYEVDADAVASTATIRITAYAYNYALGANENRELVITVIRRFPPAPPAPTPTPAAVIGVTLDIDAITLDYGETADPEFTSYDFTETVTGTANTAVTWSLDDDTFVEVDENGVVRVKDEVPQGTGDITVELTVTTVVGGATDTATILFEEQTPLGAIEFFDPYISGYTDGTFKPKQSVTRAEVAAMFANILKLNLDFPGSQKFTDVSDEHWAYSHIQAMFRTGIFVGYVDGNGVRTFDPEAAISRAEIAQVFTNYWKYLDISVTGENTATIPDVPENHWASLAINRIYNTGIFTGFENGAFKPEDPTLREQIVSMINRLIDRPANEADTSKFTDITPSNEHFGDIEAASQSFLKPQGE